MSYGNLKTVPRYYGPTSHVSAAVTDPQTYDKALRQVERDAKRKLDLERKIDARKNR